MNAQCRHINTTNLGNTIETHHETENPLGCIRVLTYYDYREGAVVHSADWLAADESVWWQINAPTREGARGAMRRHISEHE